MARDHVAIALEFQDAVLAGTVNHGRLFRACVQRHVDDLVRVGQAGFPYRWAPDQGAKMCRFAELFSHVKGPKAGERITLEPWQVWLFMVFAGWLRADGTNFRRWRRIQMWLCRGHGKTLMAAIIALWVLNEGQGGEIATAATTRDQARLALDVARGMLRQAPALAAKLGMEVGKHAITVDGTDSVMKSVSSEAGGQEGANSSCVVLDELAVHRSRDLYDTLLTGCGKRPTSLFVTISTSGSDTSGIGYEVYEYGKRILNGEVDDPSEFALIIEADQGDSPWEEATWRKANPGYGISIDPDYIRQASAKARQVVSLQSAFFSRHLGWWTSSDSQWLSGSSIDACADTSLELADFEGEPCWIGADLATRVDLAGKAYIFTKDVPREDGSGTDRHYTVFTRAYLPQSTVETSSNASYRGWAIEGFITETPGEVTDLNQIQRELIEDSQRFDVREVALDPWQAAQMLSTLTDEGVPAIEFRNTVANLSPAMAALEEAVLQKRFHWDGNPVMRWCLCNVVCHLDAKGNRFPRKPRPDAKIDLAVATLFGLARAALAAPDSTHEGIRFL